MRSANKLRDNPDSQAQLGAQCASFIVNPRQARVGSEKCLAM